MADAQFPPRPPNVARRAVIDVGTNSIKLLIADVAGTTVVPLLEDSEQTRLGTGFFETHQLQPGAIALTAEVVAKFNTTAREHGAQSVRVFATSATRDALNAADLVSAIEKASGLKVEVITGEQEADWAFHGVATDPQFADKPILLLDVGGGSSEFILGQGEHKHFRQSFRLGTVRLLERLPNADTPSAADLASCRKWVKDFLETEVRPKLDPALRRETNLDSGHRRVELVGTGGTTTILARMEAELPKYEREKIEAVRLSRERVHAQTEHLWSLSLAQRREIVGLPKKRADVILTGVVIFEGIMDTFEFKELRVSTRGLRFAAVLDEA